MRNVLQYLLEKSNYNSIIKSDEYELCFSILNYRIYIKLSSLQTIHIDESNNKKIYSINEIEIIYGFYNGDRDIMQKEFENLIFISDKDIKQIIKKYNPDIFKTSHIIDKIDQIQSLLVKHKIFKIA